MIAFFESFEVFEEINKHTRKVRHLGRKELERRLKGLNITDNKLSELIINGQGIETEDCWFKVKGLRNNVLHVKVCDRSISTLP